MDIFIGLLEVAMRDIKERVLTVLSQIQDYKDSYEMYGAEAIISDTYNTIDSSEEIIKELTERETKLADALRFYADKNNYKLAPGVASTTRGNFTNPDYGQTAAASLQSLGLQE